MIGKEGLPTPETEATGLVLFANMDIFQSYCKEVLEITDINADNMNQPYVVTVVNKEKPEYNIDVRVEHH